MMAESQRSLETKAAKYSDPARKWDVYGTSWTTNHPEVPQVLAHLGPLVSLQLHEPEPDWDHLREAGLVAMDLD